MTAPGPDRHIPSAGVAYEVARDILSELIGIYSAVLAEEKAKPSPDAGLIANRQRMLAEWIERRRTLDPGDVVAVRAVLDEDGAFLRRVYEEAP